MNRREALTALASLPVVGSLAGLGEVEAKAMDLPADDGWYCLSVPTDPSQEEVAYIKAQ